MSYKASSVASRRARSSVLGRSMCNNVACRSYAGPRLVVGCQRGSLGYRGWWVVGRREGSTLGILRETYDPWERRAPLTPDNVRNLLKAHPRGGTKEGDDDNLTILVQPCRRRCYSDDQYRSAGAIVTNDLSSADVVLGVKRPRHGLVAAVGSSGADDDESAGMRMLRDKTLLLFSHVVKGQLGNMEFLQECLDNRVQLLDYERMVTGGGAIQQGEQGPCVDQPTQPFKRLVAFGRFAGMAGAVDSFVAIGKRLLYSEDRGMCTPFLTSVPPAWMHEDVDSAKASVRRLGESIRHQGLPVPLVFAVTGEGGCVHSGVMEILQLLPHQRVSVPDLPLLHNQFKTMKESTCHKNVYIVPVSLKDAFERVGDGSFDRQDFQQNPEQYRSVFARRVAPFVDVIFNCVYWDARFPRLLTKSQMKRIYEADGRNTRLFHLTDISCDVNGSIEFLDRTTTVESPFYQYDPVLEKEVSIGVGKRGVTVLGVDILPTEFPKDSSDHFGNVVKSVIVPELLAAMVHPNTGVDRSQLSPRLTNACVTTSDGQLTPAYRYLDALLNRAPSLIRRFTRDSSMTLSLEGHLFDSGLINQILNVIEQFQGCLEFEQCLVPPLVNSKSAKSSAVVKIAAGDEMALDHIHAKIQALVDIIPNAEASLRRVDLPHSIHSFDARSKPATATVKDGQKQRNVLVLGAGHVAESVVDFLGRSSCTRVTVASESDDDARRIALTAGKNGKHAAVNVLHDAHLLSSLIASSDVVVSLLPAPLHPIVGKECIHNRTHLVTASYESDEMRALGPGAQEAGIILLNEVGLDPGLDHMSAKKAIDDIHHRGGVVTLLSSVCGGLPAPEVASCNPFKYKFSWSPRGVIRACQNSARYRWEGQVHEVHDSDLLRSASPFVDAWPGLALECIPNRDSIAYERVYDIRDVQSIFRGTLRYRGFSSLMNVFKSMGLFSSEKASGETWNDLFLNLRVRRGGFSSLLDFVEACADDDHAVAKQTMEAIEWLDLESPTHTRPDTEVADAFCTLLESRLLYERGERDMVVMHHRIEAEFEDETHEKHVSSLQVFGDSNSSAMSKTVGYTTAAAVELIMDGHLVNQCGTLLPTSHHVYLPILAKVAREGISFDEKVYIHSRPVEKSA